MTFSATGQGRRTPAEPIVSPSFTLERAGLGLQIKEDGESVCGFVTEEGARRFLVREVALALRAGLAIEVNFALLPDPWAREGRVA